MRPKCRLSPLPYSGQRSGSTRLFHVFMKSLHGRPFCLPHMLWQAGPPAEEPTRGEFCFDRSSRSAPGCLHF
jgi:hypothetical protein